MIILFIILYYIIILFGYARVQISYKDAAQGHRIFLNILSVVDGISRKSSKNFFLRDAVSWSFNGFTLYTLLV